MNPLQYAQKAILVNEFTGGAFHCLSTVISTHHGALYVGLLCTTVISSWCVICRSDVYCDGCSSWRLICGIYVDNDQCLSRCSICRSAAQRLWQIVAYPLYRLRLLWQTYEPFLFRFQLLQCHLFIWWIMRTCKMGSHTLYKQTNGK